MSLLKIQGLTKHFAVRRGVLRRLVGQIQAVSEVDLGLAPKETLALVGESGCGKSTLGRMILRLIEPTEGRIFLGGTDITTVKGAPLRALRKRMQIIFQDPYGSLNPRMSVAETLREPLMLHDVATGQNADAAIADLLKRTGLSPAMAGRFPHEFSGGQRQRIAIARALATRPKLIVCDEPVSALDVSVQAQILNLLSDLQAEFGIAYIVISHDLAVVRQVADRVAVMYLGRIVEEADAQTLFARPLHPYTRSLLEAAPRPDPRSGNLKTSVIGDAPSALAPPPGCAFHTRCPVAKPRCKQERPLLRTLGATAVACHYAEDAPAAATAHGGDISPALKTRLKVLQDARMSRKETA